MHNQRYRFILLLSFMYARVVSGSMFVDDQKRYEIAGIRVTFLQYFKLHDLISELTEQEKQYRQEIVKENQEDIYGLCILYVPTGPHMKNILNIVRQVAYVNDDSTDENFNSRVSSYNYKNIQQHHSQHRRGREDD